jgi:hypothetical protein
MHTPGQGHHNYAYRSVTRRGKSLKLSRTPSPLRKQVTSKNKLSSTRKQPKYTKINIYKENYKNPIFTNETSRAIRNVQKVHRENIPHKFYIFLQKVIHNEKMAAQKNVTLNNFSKLFDK